MKIPMAIISCFLGALVLLEAWTLNAVVELKTEVAAIKALVNNNQKNLAQK